VRLAKLGIGVADCQSIDSVPSILSRKKMMYFQTNYKVRKTVKKIIIRELPTVRAGQCAEYKNSWEAPR
jgi:hypothetical protein